MHGMPNAPLHDGFISTKDAQLVVTVSHKLSDQRLSSFLGIHQKFTRTATATAARQKKTSITQKRRSPLSY
jgi:hypothetical protein